MILDEIMKYRARQLEREKAACGLEEMQKRAEKALAGAKAGFSESGTAAGYAVLHL